MTFPQLSVGRVMQDSTMHKQATMSHLYASAHLVLLCTHCLQSTGPIQSQQSCRLVRSPLECLRIADLCGYNSCAQCKPFLQQPVEIQGTGHIRYIMTCYFMCLHVLTSMAWIKVPWPTCAAMSTRFGNFRALPSPSFKKSSKLPMKKQNHFNLFSKTNIPNREWHLVF